MTQLAIESFHGSVTRVGVSETAVPHREPGFNLLITSVWTDPTATDINVEWTGEAMPRMTPGGVLPTEGDSGRARMPRDRRDSPHTRACGSKRVGPGSVPRGRDSPRRRTARSSRRTGATRAHLVATISLRSLRSAAGHGSALQDPRQVVGSTKTGRGNGGTRVTARALPRPCRTRTKLRSTGNEHKGSPCTDPSTKGEGVQRCTRFVPA